MKTVKDLNRRRGAAAVVTAVSLTTLVGFAALAVDTGRLYVAKAELQSIADAAAMASVAELGVANGEGGYAVVNEVATRVAGLNRAHGRHPSSNNVDVVLGSASLNASSGRFQFSPGGSVYNAVRVTVAYDGSDSIATLFAPVFGSSELDNRPVAATASAMLVPRDIAVVADLSASHTDDSELAKYRQTDINLEEVWNGLPGGTDEHGPYWVYLGNFGWGTTVLDDAYNPSADPGLVYLPKNQSWSNAQVSGILAADQYSPQEINVIFSNAYDDNSGTGRDWPLRVAVALGAAQWRSGHRDAQNNPVGRWAALNQTAGDGDDRIESGELEWAPFPGDSGYQSQSARATRWQEYIRSYMDETNTGMYQANSAFRYRFGIKTLTNYLLEKRPMSSQSPDLAQTHTQPMQAVKDAVQVMVNVVEELDGDDQMSLESYDRWGAHRVDLTYNYQSVADHINTLQAGQDGLYTNMGDGVQYAIAELTGARARAHAVKLMVLLTDGMANVNASGGYTDYPGGRQWASDSVDEAIAQGIRVYAVSVGNDADVDLMREFAARGGGTEFTAQGSIEDYSAEMRNIFATLGGARPVQLIE